MNSFSYNNIFKICSFLLIICIYLASFLFIDIVPTNNGYKYTFLLPLSFVVCFHIFLWDLVKQYKSPYLIAYTFIGFFRYIILPYSLLIEGDYIGGYGYISPSFQNLQLASWLMMFEIFSVSIVTRLFYKRIVGESNRSYTLIVQKNNLIYVAFFFMFLILLFLIPQAREGISYFFNINRSANNEIGSNFHLLLRQCFFLSKYLIFFVILSYVYRKQSLSKSTLIYILILFFALVVLNIQIGTNRKSIIADAFALFFILIKVFPKRKYFTLTILSSVAIIIFSAFTIYRGFVSNGEGLFSYFLSINVLQPYLLGEYNIAMAIEAKKLFGDQIGLKNLLMDIFRPVFGIGSFLKDIPISLSVEIFAMRLSLGGLFRQDQIIPLIGQGFMYFGMVFSPVFSIIAAIAGVFCDSIYRKSRSIESSFFSAYFAINLAQAMILNITILINTITFIIGIVIPLYFVNVLINRSIDRNRVVRREKSV